MPTKVCRLCGFEKDVDDFGANHANKDKKNTMCKACRPLYMAKYKETSRRCGRAYQLRKYGLNQDSFNKILDSQGGKCAICGGGPTVYDVYVVDHDHDTGETRGLLCSHCNSGLGSFKDATKIMERAASYIKRSRVSKFRELELKLRAPSLEVSDFLGWVVSQGATQYSRTRGQDVYWRRDSSVVRHRLFAGHEAGEITVKRRTDATSTTDRVEVDLFLSPETTPEEVSAFMALSGFKTEVVLTKTSHIFNVPEDKCLLTVVMYEVNDDLRPELPTKKYVEVEVDKDADIRVSTARKILDSWKLKLEARFGLVLEPLSLWEIFSGEKYDTV